MEIKWSSFHNSFDVIEIKSYVPKEPGVYIIWVKMASGKWMPIYSGQARSLERAFIEHGSEMELNPKLKKYIQNYQCGFEYAIIKDQTTRNGVEKYLYNKYKPDCNLKDPGFVPIEVNLP